MTAVEGRRVRIWRTATSNFRRHRQAGSGWRVTVGLQWQPVPPPVSEVLPGLQRRFTDMPDREVVDQNGVRRGSADMPDRQVVNQNGVRRGSADMPDRQVVDVGDRDVHQQEAACSWSTAVDIKTAENIRRRRSPAAAVLLTQSHSEISWSDIGISDIHWRRAAAAVDIRSGAVYAVICATGSRSANYSQEVETHRDTARTAIQRCGKEIPC